MADIQLACNTAPWGTTGLIEAITDISAAGFDGIECPAQVVQAYEDRLHVFEEILETSSLQLSSLMQQIDFLNVAQADEQVERAANAARFASIAGAKVLLVCHHEVRNASMNDEEWATLGAIVEEIGERCQEFDVDLCFLPRTMRLVGADKEIKRLMASTKPEFVKLALDTAEIALAGSSPQRMAKSYIDRLRVVRYRDASASKRRAKTTSTKPGSTPQFGRGAVNFEAVSKALLSEGYRGWITLDVSGENQPPEDAVRAGYRFLLRKSGLFPVL